MSNYFVILAAGSGKRFSKNKAKQFFVYKNKQVFEHSVNKALNQNFLKNYNCYKK